MPTTRDLRPLPRPRAAAVAAPAAGHRPDVSFAPILDVARGVVAGYRAQPRWATLEAQDGCVASPLDLDLDGSLTADVLAGALAEVAGLPVNTFLTVPVQAGVAGSPAVREVLAARGDLSGVVIDLVRFSGVRGTGSAVAGSARIDLLDVALDAARVAGALLAIGGHDAAQPELSSVLRFRPAFLRLGRDWVRGVDGSESKRRAIEVVGRLAGQLDSWVIAEGIESAAELRALAGLGVPLAEGPFIGAPAPCWAPISPAAVGALPRSPDVSPTGAGALTAFVQPAYTARDAGAAAAVLPETSGFDVVVVVDAEHRPRTLLERTESGAWVSSEVMAVHVDTPVADVIARALTRPRATRFTPVACTDEGGRLLGVIRLEHLMQRLSSAGAR